VVSAQQLSQLGEIAPTKVWVGEMPQPFRSSRDVASAVLQSAFLGMFGAAPPAAVDEYVPVPFETALVLLVLAFRPPFLGVLARVGNNREDGEYFAPDDLPPDGAIAAMRQALGPLGRDAKALSNTDDTGAWAQVDPARDDLEELLVVLYSEASIVALYWAQAID
jgi:hypothetical protein